MNSLVRVFSNFKEFYNEINGATLTGAIDVIVVEQPDGEFLCSPFHVRFGKLGVLRSREKIVDIEINGEPVDIHMKLGDSGEAFFVEECPESEIEELPENLATSPIPTSFNKYADRQKYATHASDEIHPLPIPRRNSIDLLKEHTDENKENIFENQVSDFSHRRHTDNTLDRRNLSTTKKEYTTQKIRQEWAELEDKLLQLNTLENNDERTNNAIQNKEEKQQQNSNDNLISQPKQSKLTLEITKENQSNQQQQQQQLKQQQEQQKCDNSNAIEETDNKNNKTTDTTITISPAINTSTITNASNTKIKDEISISNNNNVKDDLKSKKKRRKKTQIKKKNSQNLQRKSSSSSSIGSIQLDNNEPEPDTISLSNNTTGSSNDESSSKVDENSSNSDNKTIIAVNSLNDNKEHTNIQTQSTANRLRDLDIHFFSDTEVVSVGLSPHCSRPSTPIQSDSELEISQREKVQNDSIMTNSASWKWGELPQTEEQKDVQVQQHNSMLSGMFSFMKKTNKLRKNVTSEGIYLSDLDTECMDPEMAALYFPPVNNKDTSLNILSEEDRESGNGTSLPHSPSSMEAGTTKSLDSDYDDGRTEKYLDFVAMSLCGGIEKENGPNDSEFDRHIIKYSDVCKNPGIFSSPNLVVRLNGKYYSWTAACPIVMTIITFQKPLTDEAIDHLMNISKLSTSGIGTEDEGSTTSIKNCVINNENITSSASSSASVSETKRGYSWWYWRRSGGDKRDDKNRDSKEIDQAAVATQTSRANTPDHPDSIGQSNPRNADNADDTSDSINMSMLEKISENSLNYPKEKYRKSLRLSSKSIKSLNLKPGMNEIEFSVTTAYQGTSRCKCYLFRWKYNDKVVISDIDGTITKSDVLGHILPMVGKDWAQIGVAQLFSKIEANGYKLLYLSARAIGQSRVTREYLRSIRQGDVKLPDGPLLLNPTSLISAFHREVIEKKPEQFKIACLTDIQALFPENPFYAGYGNRINDVWAYRAVGIPIMRIFTINTKGELKHELTQTFQSSYCSMTYIVDQLFPPIKDDEGTIEYSYFNYWRDPVPEIDIDVSELTTNLNNVNNNNNNNNANNANNINNANVNNGSNNTNLTTLQQNTATQLSSKMLATIPEN